MILRIILLTTCLLFSSTDITSIKPQTIRLRLKSSRSNSGRTQLTIYSIENELKMIPELRTSKIIALGECAHGSQSIKELVFQIIKYQVLNNHCRLILVEYPLEETLLMNAYIQAEQGIKLQDIITKTNRDLMSTSFIKILYWLRKYNEISREKVYLLGTDISLTAMQAMECLTNYVEVKNKYRKLRVLDNLLDNLRGFKQDENSIRPISDDIKKIKNTCGYLLKHKILFRSLLGKCEVKLLEYILVRYYSKGLIYATELKLKSRDLFMKENVELFKQMYLKDEDSMIIYSHLMHTTPNSFPKELLSIANKPSMGTLLKKIYGSDYFVIGLLIGEGSVFNYNPTKPIKKLKSPPIESIEHLLLTQNISLKYLDNLENWENIPVRLVTNGSMKRQFFKFTPYKMMDAAFFIKKSCPLKFNTKQLYMYE